MHLDKKSITVLIIAIVIGASLWFAYSKRQSTPAFTISNMPTKGSVVKTAVNSELGTYLTDQNRLTLYVSLGQCAGKCLDDWIPYRVNPDISLESDDPLLQKISTTKTGTIWFSKEIYQYTYLGRRLYYYRYDRNPGEINGSNVSNGEWAALINP
mgnify:FL=1